MSPFGFYLSAADEQEAKDSPASARTEKPARSTAPEPLVAVNRGVDLDRGFWLCARHGGKAPRFRFGPITLLGKVMTEAAIIGVLIALLPFVAVAVLVGAVVVPLVFVCWFEQAKLRDIFWAALVTFDILVLAGLAIVCKIASASDSQFWKQSSIPVCAFSAAFLVPTCIFYYFAFYRPQVKRALVERKGKGPNQSPEPTRSARGSS